MCSASSALPTVHVSAVLDFMCPWSFIALRSLALAKQRFAGQLNFAPTAFTPYEFDPPGTYPPEGRDWTDYCRGFGEAKAKFLLEDKLPRAFALGRAVGIDFKMKRNIVHVRPQGSISKAAHIPLRYLEPRPSVMMARLRIPSLAVCRR